jgi:hypothetical protein
MNLIICLGYKDIYQEIPPEDISSFLDNIPINPALAFICDLTAQIYLNDFEDDSNFKQFNLVKNWISNFDNTVKSNVYNLFYKNLQKGKIINIINQTTSLFVLDSLLLKKVDYNEKKELSPENLESLFKFYLSVTSKWSNNQSKNIQIGKTDFKFYPLLLSLAYDEHFKVKDFRIQLIKIFYFFDFCNSNADFNMALDSFFHLKKVQNWKEYILFLSTSYAQLLKSERIKTAMNFSNDINDQLLFSCLKNFIINPEDYRGEPDFVEIRSFPLYKLSTNILLFLNFNFFIDKIYRGFIFDFADTLIDHKIKIGNLKIKSRPDFFKITGKNFIEISLFGQIVKATFPNSQYHHFDSQKLELLIGDGAPDYMIIDKAKVYVFEFKNVHFNGNVKVSGDLSQIISEIRLKLFENSDKKPKGIRQLVSFIKRIKLNEFRSIFNRSGDEIIIYPIILTNESVFDLNGITLVIDSLYLSEICHLNCGGRIKDLTMINLDTLIKYKELFVNKNLKLNHVLSDYRDFLNRQIIFDNKGLSFDQYMKSKTSRYKGKYMDYFLNEFKTVLPQD